MIPLKPEEVKRQRQVLKFYEYLQDMDKLGSEFYMNYKNRGLAGGMLELAQNGRDVHALFSYEENGKEFRTNLYITPFDVFGDDKFIPEYVKLLRRYFEAEFGKIYVELCAKYDKYKKNNLNLQKYDEHKDRLLEAW